MTRAATGDPIELVGVIRGYDDTGNFDTKTISGNLSIEAGDLAVFLFASYYTDRSATVSDDFIELVDQADSSFSSYCFVKTLVGDETAISVTDVSAFDATTYLIAVFRNAALPVVGDIVTSDGSTGMPDCAESTAGSSTDWILAAGFIRENVQSIDSAPTNYTFREERGWTVSTFSSTTMLATRTGVAGTDNPSAFVKSGASDPWHAHTLRIKRG